MINTVIFDLDGTLLDTLDDLMDSVNFSLDRYGFKKRSREEIRCFVGNGIRKLIERALPENYTDDDFEKVFEEFKQNYKVHCNDKTKAYPGVIELLKKLKEKNIRTAIVTNKAKFAADALNDIYFDGLVDVVMGAVDGRPVKPDPYMVECVLESSGAKKEETLYVGDSQVDVMTGKNAGLRTIAVLWGFRNREELLEAGAEEFIEKPMELINFLQ